MSKYKVATYCDYGEAGREDVVHRHRDWDTALRQYKRIARTLVGIWGYHCWQDVWPPKGGE